MATEVAGTTARSEDRRPNRAFVASIAAMALLPVAVTGTNLAFPSIEQDFAETSRTVLSWALSGYSIVLAAFTLLGGQLSDRFDAKRIFLAGLSVFGLASLLAAIAPNAAVLIAGRSLQGIGGALIVPSSLIVVTSQWPADRRTWVIGVWTAAFPIGSAAAPSLTAVILQVGSWRWVFALMTIIAIAVAALVAPIRIGVQEGASTQADGSALPRPDIIGIVIGTAAVGLLALGIVEGPTWGWLSWRIIGALGIAAALVPLFIRRSLRHPRPLIDLRLFRIPTYSVASGANVFISIAGMSVWLIWPLFMTNQWGYSQIAVGLAITPTPMLAGVVSILSTRWSAVRGYRSLLVPGSIVLIGANLWYLTMLGTEPAYATEMLPGLIMYGIGMGLTFAPVNAAALGDVPPSQYGQANAGFSTGRFLSGAIGIAAVIAALGEGDDPDPMAPYDRGFTMLAIASALAAVLLVVAWPRRATAPAET
jgi:EmrB/QacA subfamily drug resistance transporter